MQIEKVRRERDERLKTKHQRKSFGQMYFKTLMMRDHETGEIKARCVYKGCLDTTRRGFVYYDTGSRLKVQKYFCNVCRRSWTPTNDIHFESAKQ